MIHGDIRRWLRATTALCGLGAATVIAAGLPAQASGWTEQGPGTSVAPSSAPDITGVSGMMAQGDPVTGGIGTVITRPGDPTTMWVGAVNGGIWKTTNGGANWTPLTDHQSSLSIGAIALDTTDTTYNTLVAGFGATSNAAQASGPLNGLIRSTNGGATWSAVNSTGLSGSVDGVIARGGTIIAGTDNLVSLSTGGGSSGGLYRSTGSGFTAVDLSTQTAGAVANGAVSALISDNNSTGTGERLFAAVVDTATGKPGVVMSQNGGSSWSAVFTGATIGSATAGANVSAPVISPFTTPTTISSIKLAPGPNGSLFVGVVNSAGAVQAVYYSPTGTGNFVNLGIPNFGGYGINPGGQGLTNFAMVADPTTPGKVYLTGDTTGTIPQSGIGNSTYSGIVVSMTATNSGGWSSSVTSLVNSGTASYVSGTSSGSAPHADGRVLAIDSTGTRLIEGSDGGIYVRPLTAGDWTSLNGSTDAGGAPLRVREVYSAAFDANTKRIIAAAQDTGVSLQNGGNSANWTQAMSGDGFSAGVNDRSFVASNNLTVFYAANNNLGLNRIVLNATTGALVTQEAALSQATLDAMTAQEGGSLPLASGLAVNKLDPTKLALFTNRIYTATENAWDPVGNTFGSLSPLDRSGGSNLSIAGIGAAAYGAPGSVDALAAADANGNVWVTTSPTAAMTQMAATGFSPATSPTALLFNGSSANVGAQKFFIADGANIFATADQGNTFATLALPANLQQPRGLEWIEKNGVSALLAGGVSSVANGNNIYATSNPYAPGAPTWMALGGGMPNALVNSLSYNPAVDVLTVATLGRGVWTLYDATTYFPTATSLVFGAAGNDSSPGTLTDGTDVNGNPFSRGVVKDGGGTLYVSTTNTYTGGTTVRGGTMVIGPGGNLPGATSLAGGTNLVFDPGTGNSVTTGGDITGAGTITALSGTLNMANNMAATRVASGATLAAVANRTVNGALYNGGTLDLGTNTLTVTGNLTGAGTIRTTIGAGASGNIANTGATAGFTPGGAFRVTPTLSGITPTSGSRYVLISENAAPGALNATVDSTGTLHWSLGVGTGAGGVDALSRTIGANDLVLTVQSIGVDTSGMSANDASVLSVISTYSGADPAKSALTNEVNSLPADQLSTVAKQLAPTDSTVTWSGASQATSQTLLTVAHRTEDIHTAQADGTGVATGEAMRGLAVWGQAIGQVAHQGTMEGIEGYRMSSAGFAFGGDAQVLDSMRVGAGFAYATTGVNQIGALAGDNTNIISRVGFLYGTYDAGNWYVDGRAAYSAHSFSTNRQVLGTTANANFGGQQVEGVVEAGMPFPVNRFRLTPVVMADWSRLYQDGYSESGAAGLTVAGTQATSWKNGIGLKADTLMGFDGVGVLKPQVRAMYTHDYMGSAPVTTSFYTVGGPAFTNIGPTPARDALWLGANVTLQNSNDTQVSVSYDSQSMYKFFGQNLTVQIRQSF